MLTEVAHQFVISFITIAYGLPENRMISDYIYIQMSNKNLKVYRIQFITEAQDLQFKVKFPCQVKMIWKRSNQSAQTTLVPVENGVVNFNQTLKLFVNMYFDTTINKFVEKKCIYSFLIVTDKGEKSAGSITYDLAEFFNKRIYEVDQYFPLQKCPLPDTKIKLKIYYEESTETGYDSMSRISTAQQLDTSTASMDMSELAEHHQSSAVTESRTKKQEEDTASKEPSSQKDKEETQSNYDLLNQSDLGANIVVGVESNENNQKISENIQALNKITGKINQFVSRCSGNIKHQIQNLKHKNKELEESLSSAKFQVSKLSKEKEQSKATISGLERSVADMKVSHESALKKQKQKLEEMTHKYEQSHKLCSQLQNSLQQKGSSQTSYLSSLQKSFQQRQTSLKSKIQNLNEQLDKSHRQKNELSSKITKYESTMNDYKERLTASEDRNKQYQIRQAQREKQLSELRYRLENVYTEIVKSLGNIVQ